MKIFVAGTRGVPDIPGGVEKHCEQLYPRIAAQGIEVYLTNRIPYVQKRVATWKRLHLIYLFTPRKKSLEAIVHTALAIITAKRRHADIVHIHAVGPGLLVPFAKLLGLTVVVTNHGPDYNRQKWNKLAKKILFLGEYWSGKYADAVICISPLIQKTIRQRCRRNTVLIKNGVDIPSPAAGTDFLHRHNLEPGRYILAVSRFVPEKGLDLLVQAFRKLKTDVKLVIAGDADHESEYSDTLKKMIDAAPGAIRTGYVTGDPLHQLYSHARLFVLPSYHEGLPIAMLEALSYCLQVVVSDIPANCQVDLDAQHFFQCGSVNALYDKMQYFMERPITGDQRAFYQARVKKDYNWEDIAAQTVQVYKECLKNHSKDKVIR